MTCTSCLKTIDKSKGYYLVSGVSYCKDCYDEPANTTGITGKYHSPTDLRSSENLLEAFREYQRRDQKMVCQGW